MRQVLPLMLAIPPLVVPISGVACGGAAAERQAYEDELAAERRLQQDLSEPSSDSVPDAGIPPRAEVRTEPHREEDSAPSTPRFGHTRLLAFDGRLGGFYGWNSQDNNTALPILGIHAGLEPWLGDLPVGVHFMGGAEFGFLVGAKGGMTVGLSGEIGLQFALSPQYGTDRQGGTVLFLSWAPRALYSFAICDCQGPDGTASKGQVAAAAGGELALKFDGGFEIPIWFLHTQDDTNFLGLSAALHGSL
jgi:hypothetical protein